MFSLSPARSFQVQLSYFGGGGSSGPNVHHSYGGQVRSTRNLWYVIWTLILYWYYGEIVLDRCYICLGILLGIGKKYLRVSSMFFLIYVLWIFIFHFACQVSSVGRILLGGIQWFSGLFRFLGWIYFRGMHWKIYGQGIRNSPSAKSEFGRNSIRSGSTNSCTWENL